MELVSKQGNLHNLKALFTNKTPSPMANVSMQVAV